MAWADDRDGSAGYVTVTTLATAIDEAVPFVVVYMSDLSASFWAAMDTASDTDGKTIRVSTSDGTTQLACVPIGVNTGTDTGCLIFLGTGMSASVDVDYRIYVGNASLSMPTASGGMGEQAVFASYSGVYFPGVDTRDWTSGGRTLTATGSPTTDTSGYEGITAAKYNGTSQYHGYDGTLAVGDNLLTFEALAYSTTTSSGVAQVIMGYTDASNSYSIMSLRFRDDLAGNSVGFLNVGNGGSLHNPVTSSAYTASTWHYAAGVRTTATTSGDTVAYIDGGNAGTATGTMSAPLSRNKLRIGVFDGSSVLQYLPGRVAVALISGSARSADYISTMQDNWAGTMYTAGAWTALDTDVVAGSTGWVLFQTIGQSTSAAADWTNTADALVDDANTAECTLDDGGVFESEYLNFTNPAYGTTIPTGAPSYTIEFRIKKKSDTSSAREVQDLTVQFIDDTGTRVGDNEADTITDWPSALGTVDYVVSGLTPDGTEVTSAAGMALRVTGVNTNGATLTEVATAWIRVSWTGTDAAYNTRGFFALTE
jgi:hypothetical protein